MRVRLRTHVRRVCRGNHDLLTCACAVCCVWCTRTQALPDWGYAPSNASAVWEKKMLTFAATLCFPGHHLQWRAAGAYWGALPSGNRRALRRRPVRATFVRAGVCARAWMQYACVRACVAGSRAFIAVAVVHNTYPAVQTVELAPPHPLAGGHSPCELHVLDQCVPMPSVCQP